jgi:glyoxylase-like metal-dependent hydrolase (beta-lactamase superfamily II)
MKIQTYVLGMVSTNCYIIFNESTNEALIIDPPDQAPALKVKIEELDLSPVAILLTHGHFDHIMAAGDLAAAFGIPVLAGEDEKALLEDYNLNGSRMVRKNYTLSADRFLKDKEEFTLGGMRIKVIHTPGHTAGGVCYYFEEDKVLISGDTLFLESIGRTDLPTGDQDTLLESIRRKLMILPEEVFVYPGHGDKTTIGYEKIHNPYIGENNFWD